MLRLIATAALLSLSMTAAAQSYHVEMDGKWYRGSDLTRVTIRPGIDLIDSYVTATNCRRPGNALPLNGPLGLALGTGTTVELAYGEEVLYFAPKGTAPAFFSMTTVSGNVGCTFATTGPTASRERLTAYRNRLAQQSNIIFANGFER